MKRTVPLLITAIAGFVLIVAFFIPSYQGWGEDTAVWFDILASIAFILGGGNLLKVHLKKVSDRQRGWGYSGVTILAFLGTLFVGLTKIGTNPAANTEYFGESFAPVPLSLLPEVRLPGEIPVRADGKLLPPSVRQQLRQVGSDVVFRGWMRPNQLSDLIDYQDTLNWRCLVERLSLAAQPPEALRGKLSYYVEHASISFRGFMTDADHANLLALFDGNDVGTQAVERLREAARRQVSVPLRAKPPGLELPGSAAEFLSVDEGSLTIRGPMTPDVRHQLVETWSGFARIRPMTQTQEQELMEALNERGSPLNAAQQTVISSAINGIWTAEQLQQAIDGAGQPELVPYTSCELQEQMQSGANNLVASRFEGTPVTLNEQQRREIQRFATQPTLSVDELVTALGMLGELSAGQRAALEDFLLQQPTVAQWRHDLWSALLVANRASGAALSRDQQDYLLREFREEYKFRQSVGDLLLRSHVTKYPWSGAYADPGSPFWWCYTYLFQPLTATMFALLAFYVASAAFRAFRAKNIEAILLLATAFIILLGRTFAGVLLTAWLPDWLGALKIDQMTVYIMSVFNTAGNRAIMIGIALGIASTSLKVLLGVDRSYLGSGGE